MTTETVDQLRVLIDGLVQGVGFRHATLIEAQARGLTGWVRNLADGRVEARFEGERAALDGMLQWCHRGPHLSEIRTVTPVWTQGPRKFSDFQITFSIP